MPHTAMNHETLEAVSTALSTMKFDLIGPEIILALAGCLALVAERLVGAKRQFLVGYTAFLGVIASLAYLVLVIAPRALEGELIAFSGLFVHDSFAVFFKILFLVATALTILMSMRYLEEEEAHHGEYYALLCFATLGMMFMASGRDLVTIFVGLELMALSLYVLVGFLRQKPRSNEASMKYFILGAFSSGFFIYGISLFYGVAGTTVLSEMRVALSTEASNPMVVLALMMISVGLAFKVAAVPFHAWAPDTYEGAPTPITAFISVASKSAAFAILMRILLVGLYDLRDQWTTLLTILTIATIVFGNLVAIVQDNVKRMLAYSSIAHAGYVLIGILAAGSSIPADVASGMSVQGQIAWMIDLQSWAQGGVLIYLFAYTFMNIGVFGLVTLLRRQNIVGDDIRDFAGLGQRSPAAAVAMSILLLSLGGIPPTAGFIGKLILFGAAVKAGCYTVVAIALLMTAVSIFFYFRIVVMMWMKEPRDDTPYAFSPELGFSIVVSLLFTIGVGVLPQYFLDLAQRSILVLPATLSAFTSLQ